MEGEAEVWYCGDSLHVTLGWVQRKLDRLEAVCIALDASIIAAFGSHSRSYELSQISSDLQEMLLDLADTEDKESGARAEIDRITEERAELRKDPEIAALFDCIYSANRKKCVLSLQPHSDPLHSCTVVCVLSPVVCC